MRSPNKPLPPTPTDGILDDFNCNDGTLIMSHNKSFKKKHNNNSRSSNLVTSNIRRHKSNSGGADSLTASSSSTESGSHRRLSLIGKASSMPNVSTLYFMF